MNKLIGPTYSLSSCDCINCDCETDCNKKQNNIQHWPVQKVYDITTNNLGLHNCNQLNDIKNCKNNNYVGFTTEPKSQKTKDYIHVLNPDFGLTLQPGFYPKNCPSLLYPKGVTANDSRLIHAPTNLRLTLDKPPYSGSVPLDQIYSDKLTNYGKNYTNYQTVNGGQIMYYVNDNTKETYFSPNYVISSNIDVNVFKTPMGGLWPRYDKTPLTKNNRYISPQQFTRHTIAHREDLMSRQSAVFNRRKFPL